MKTNNPLSLYVHIPFCHNICGYCDFTKLIYNKKLADEYLLSLKKELCSLEIKHQLKTVYVGGGTPSSLEDEQFSFLLRMLRVHLAKDYEFTVECNPESLTKRKLEIMKECGVNRLSIGVESTDDNILKAIGRQHTFKMVKDVVREAKEMGMRNISLDLIIGLPHVSKEMLRKDIENLISLDVEHISCYSLTVHPNTKFYLDGIEEQDSSLAREYYDIVNEILENNGFIHYEVSNWSKPSFESTHNLVYWRDEEYYAIGLGASSYVHPYRRKNTMNMAKYLKGDYVSEEELVTEKDNKVYFIMLNLRTIHGLDLKKYQNLFNEDLLEAKQKEIEELISSGLIKHENHLLIPTYEGMMLLDQVILKLIS